MFVLIVKKGRKKEIN